MHKTTFNVMHTASVSLYKGLFSSTGHILISKY